MLQCHMLLVCLCTCGCVLRSSSMPEHPSMSRFFPLTLKLQNCKKHRWEPRQRPNGDPDGEGRVIWKADKSYQKHNAEAAQERWRRVISWRGETDRKKRAFATIWCCGGACSCLITVWSTVSLLYFSPITAKISLTSPNFQFGTAERKSLRIICNSQTSLWMLFHYRAI